MDFLFFFFFIVVVVLLFIILNNQKSQKSALDRLSGDVNELDNKLLFILKHMATKYDLSQLKLKQNVDLESETDEAASEMQPAKEEQQPDPELMKPQIAATTKVSESKIGKEQIPTTTDEQLEEKGLVEESAERAYAAAESPKDEPKVASEPVEQPVQHSLEEQVVQPIAQQQNVQDIPPADRHPYPYQVNMDPEDAEKGFVEKVFGGNLLAKIGIVTLVLGIGFFVKYAIDQGWINEVARVAIGLVVGGTIITIAHKLKEKYNVFSSILVGGGISVFYVTITLAFREYEIFSQPVAFALLIGVTIFSVILSLLYNRQELAIFSLVGGVLAPLMVSTGEGNYIVLFSYMLILNTGMLIISLKKNWKIVNIIAYLASLLFFWGWLIGKFDSEYLGASIFAVLFFVQFYALAIIKHLREGHRMSIFQAMLILTNNLSVLLALMFILNDYTPDLRGVVTLILAVANAVIMMTLFRQTKVDRNLIYLIIAVVMSFVSLSIPIQLKGHVITMFWAAETVLLLWLWQKSKIQVFYFGFLALSFLSLVSYGMDLTHGYVYSYEDTGLSMFSNKMFVTGVVMILSYGASLSLLTKNKDEEFAKNIDIAVFFRFMFIILLFIVPFLELNYQLTVQDYVQYSDLVLATYTTLFVAILSLTYRKKIGIISYVFLMIAVLLYATVYEMIAIDLRADIYCFEFGSAAYFLVHLLSLPAIASIIYVLVKNTKGKKTLTLLSWILVILTTLILSVELDHIVIMLFGDYYNYYTLLDDTHTFGYPILWGLIAMVLMIWGLKRKEVVLRKISLISFALIIVKFYAYDVLWQKSQVGKIVSFVILGVILLVVSFMQQKIKVLVQKDETIEEETIEEEKEIEE